VSLLRAADLTFGYGRKPASGVGTSRPPEPSSGALVIGGVSLAIARGAFVGILGPNGSGKTTLLKLLAGTLAPASGVVRLNGRDVRTLGRRDLARRLAVVPQETHLAFDYTALEIVLMGRYPHLGAFAFESASDLAAAHDAMATTGTAEFASRPFATLSGGEKQRVIIASALAQLDRRTSTDGVDASSRPRRAGEADSHAILLLDEPTASLDLKYQLQIASILRRLNEGGLTVVLSTHDLRLARALCSRLVLLAGGRVLAEGMPGDVLTPSLVGQLYGVDAALTAPVLG
jgi:iron complex transport system ATP-binding protein